MEKYLRFMPLLALFFLLTSGMPAKHPFYVSMTDVSWNPKTKSLEIAVRMFTDDLEKGLSAACKCKIDMGNDAGMQSSKNPLLSYLKTNLRFFSGGKELYPSFEGMEKEEESIWTYLQIDLEKMPENLEIENKLLFSIQEKQTNLVRLRKPGFDKTLQLMNPESRFVF
jgi:hypothetical protein